MLIVSMSQWAKIYAPLMVAVDPFFLQAIKDAEDQLEIAKIDYEKSKDKIRQLKMKKQENMKEAVQSEGLELPGVQINIKELHDVLFRDVGNKIKDSGK